MCHDGRGARIGTVRGGRGRPRREALLRAACDRLAACDGRGGGGHVLVRERVRKGARRFDAEVRAHDLQGRDVPRREVPRHRPVGGGDTGGVGRREDVRIVGLSGRDRSEGRRPLRVRSRRDVPHRGRRTLRLSGRVRRRQNGGSERHRPHFGPLRNGVRDDRDEDHEVTRHCLRGGARNAHGVGGKKGRSAVFRDESVHGLGVHVHDQVVHDGRKRRPEGNPNEEDRIHARDRSSLRAETDENKEDQRESRNENGFEKVSKFRQIHLHEFAHRPKGDLGREMRLRFREFDARRKGRSARTCGGGSRIVGESLGDFRHEKRMPEALRHRARNPEKKRFRFRNGFAQRRLENGVRRRPVREPHEELSLLRGDFNGFQLRFDHGNRIGAVEGRAVLAQKEACGVEPPGGFHRGKQVRALHESRKFRVGIENLGRNAVLDERVQERPRFGQNRSRRLKGRHDPLGKYGAELRKARGVDVRERGLEEFRRPLPDLGRGARDERGSHGDVRDGFHRHRPHVVHVHVHLGDEHHEEKEDGRRKPPNDVPAAAAHGRNGHDGKKPGKCEETHPGAVAVRADDADHGLQDVRHLRAVPVGVKVECRAHRAPPVIAGRAVTVLTAAVPKTDRSMCST